jgi:hypothetical protein
MNCYEKEPRNLPSLSYISNSKISCMLDGQQHFHMRYFKGYRKPPTPAMVKGKQLDQAILHPQLFEKNLTNHDFKDWRTKESQKWREETMASNPNAIILGKDEIQEYRDIIDSVHSHKIAGAILKNNLQDRYGYAADDDFGLLMSALDIRTGDGLIGDLKAVNDVDLFHFTRKCYEMRWFMQLAFYQHVDKLITGNQEKDNCFFIAVDTSAPPYTTEVITFDRQTTDTDFYAMGETLWRSGALKIRNMLAGGPSGERHVWIDPTHEIKKIKPELWMVGKPEFAGLIGVGA